MTLINCRVRLSQLGTAARFLARRGFLSNGGCVDLSPGPGTLVKIIGKWSDTQKSLLRQSFFEKSWNKNALALLYVDECNRS
jgi:hypothetical protein